MLMTFSLPFSKMGARQGLAQTHIAAKDHAQRSAPPIDLVWLTRSWMTVHDKRNLGDVSGWGALHLRNGSESHTRFLMRALPVMWAVHGSASRFMAAARPGDGALPNSDMCGSEPFDYKMIEVLTQPAHCIPLIYIEYNGNICNKVACGMSQ